MKVIYQGRGLLCNERQYKQIANAANILYGYPVPQRGCNHCVNHHLANKFEADKPVYLVYKKLETTVHSEYVSLIEKSAITASDATKTSYNIERGDDTPIAEEHFENENIYQKRLEWGREIHLEMQKALLGEETDRIVVRKFNLKNAIYLKK